MVALKGDKITSIPIKDAIKKKKLVPINCQMIKTAVRVGTSFGNNELTGW